MSLFNHVARLPPEVPMNQILDLQVHSVKSRPPHQDEETLWPSKEDLSGPAETRLDKPLPDLWANMLNIGHRAMQPPQMAM